MKRVALLVLALSACTHQGQGPTEPGGPKKEAQTKPSDLGPSVVDNTANQNGSKPLPTDPTAVTPAQPPAKVKVIVRAIPKALVSWGKKKLGVTPVTLERPRDSGPVDLVIRSAGYFPIHTRAYTVKTDVISVKMTKLTDRMSLFGARQEIPEEQPTSPLDPNAPPPSTAPVQPAPAPTAPTTPQAR
jgi:hypothetical protein